MDGFAELIERKRQGSLKVYLGYAAGVGKTYAMLQEGLRLKQQHVDVVIGYLEPHDRPETMALAEHLETVPPREWRVGDAVFHEMDVEAILARKPQVVLVDELAHTNADGSKNDKRYSDVLEVLAQGINVISTINVQHLESVAARVEEATGIAVRERIPDTVLRRADQVVNVDVTKRNSASASGKARFTRRNRPNGRCRASSPTRTCPFSASCACARHQGIRSARSRRRSSSSPPWPGMRWRRSWSP